MTRNPILHNGCYISRFNLPMIFCRSGIIQVCSLQNFFIVKLFTPLSIEHAQVTCNCSKTGCSLSTIHFDMLKHKIIYSGKLLECVKEMPSIIKRLPKGKLNHPRIKPGSFSTNSCSSLEPFIKTSGYTGLWGCDTARKGSQLSKGHFSRTMAPILSN